MLFSFTFFGCEDKDDGGDDPSNHVGTTGALFGGSHSANVQGYLTDSEWATVIPKLKTALNGAYTTGGLPAQNVFNDAFEANAITIIVEKNPAGYTTWKTVGNNKTLYIAYSKLDSISSVLKTAFEALSGTMQG